jgi:hypothetical protein
LRPTPRGAARRLHVGATRRLGKRYAEECIESGARDAPLVVATLAYGKQRD